VTAVRPRPAWAPYFEELLVRHGAGDESRPHAAPTIGPRSSIRLVDRGSRTGGRMRLRAGRTGLESR
jgi:hypothetical protein